MNVSKFKEGRATHALYKEHSRAFIHTAKKLHLEIPNGYEAMACTRLVYKNRLITLLKWTLLQNIIQKSSSSIRNTLPACQTHCYELLSRNFKW